MEINFKNIFSCFLILFLFELSISVQASGISFESANKLYKSRQYSEAIQQYDSLIKMHGSSAEVYYNLGNAYFKNENFGKAIVNFSRATKLNPDDEDAAFNLKLAQSKIKDKIDAMPQIFYKAWLNKAARLFSGNVWSIITISLFWIFFFMLALYFLATSDSRKRNMFFACITFLLLSLLSFGLAWQNNIIFHHSKNAVIVADNAYVKSSPDEKGVDQFVLHEGTQFIIEDEIDAWLKIRLVNGNVGWLKKSSVEII